MSEKKAVIGRMVRVNLWTDDKFPFMSDDAQAVWFHVYTNPMTNGLGLYHATIEGLAAARRWDSKRYRKGFGECLANGLFMYDETYHVVYFPNFLKHNKPANPNVLKNLILSWDYIPNSVFKSELKANICALGATYKAVMKDCKVTLPQTYDVTLPQTFSQTYSQTGTGTVTGIGSGKTNSPTEESSSSVVPTPCAHTEDF